MEDGHEDETRANSKPAAAAAAESKSNRSATTNIGDSLFAVNPTPSLISSNPFASTTSNASPFSISKPAGGASAGSKLAAPSSQATSAVSNLSQTFASVLSLNDTPASQGPAPPPEPWPPESAFPPSYPLYYLVHGDYETLDLDTFATKVPIIPRTMDMEDEGGTASQREDKDIYESTIDKIFQNFADRLAQNPEQVIRYEFKGQPLLYSKTDVVGRLLAPSAGPGSKITTGQGIESKIPRCRNCGSARVFEVQLTPHAITELEADDLSLEGMEWGTILIGVCERDCAPQGMERGAVGYLEEWAGVQWEETREKA